MRFLPRVMIAFVSTLLILGCGNAIIGISTTGIDSVKRGESESLIVYVRFTDTSNSWAGKAIDFSVDSPPDIEVSPISTQLILNHVGNAEVKLHLKTKPDIELGQKEIEVTAKGSDRQYTTLKITFEVK